MRPPCRSRHLGALTVVLVALTAVVGATVAGRGIDAALAQTSIADPAEPLRGDGMWIWYVSRAAGGDVNRIARRAHRRGIETLFIKSGDGGRTWRQFTPALVDALQARGLNVCAWQFVYGRRAKREARVGARAVRRGADCLVIDAESDYEGRYAKASTYVRVLRRRIGAEFPLALASFPYVDYHPSFPYSVFLGPRGAQFNVPQLYWRTIGDSVDAAFAHTYSYNRVYESPIFPLGQVYLNPPPRQIVRFRKLALAHGSEGVSWWSWQHAKRRGWRAVGRPIAPLVGYLPTTRFPYLRTGSRGDVVVWAQQLLAGGGYTGAITGYFGPRTRAAVRAFQADHGLDPTGQIRRPTWKALLAALDPLPIRWTRRGAVRAGSGGGEGEATMPEPPSARLPARAYEIPRRM